MITHCVFIGDNAGTDITDGDHIVIIGDNIRNLKPEDNKDVLFINDYIAIGKTLFGKPLNLADIIRGRS